MTQKIGSTSGASDFAAQDAPERNEKAQLANIVDLDGMEPMTSAQMQFAKLQLGQSQAARAQAHERMAKLQDIHAQHEHLSKTLRALHTRREKMGKGSSPSEFNDIKKLLQELGMTLTTGKKEMEVPEWQKKQITTRGGTFRVEDIPPKFEDWVGSENMDLAIQNVQTRVSIVGTETQSLLTMANDFMGQYNAYLQGARQAIAEAQSLQTKIQTGRPG